MIEYRNGDLLEQKDLNVIIHQCNCFCTMGSGLAKQIANKYPEVQSADYQTIIGDKNKLGNYTFAKTSNDKIIINLYSQFYYGYKVNSCYTDYDALKIGLTKIIEDLTSDTIKTQYDDLFNYHGMKEILNIGIPYRLGCDRGGGKWFIVENILKELFSNREDINLVIVQKDETINDSEN